MRKYILVLGRCVSLENGIIFGVAWLMVVVYAKVLLQRFQVRPGCTVSRWTKRTTTSSSGLRSVNRTKNCLTVWSSAAGPCPTPPPEPHGARWPTRTRTTSPSIRRRAAPPASSPCWRRCCCSSLGYDDPLFSNLLCSDNNVSLSVPPYWPFSFQNPKFHVWFWLYSLIVYGINVVGPQCGRETIQYVAL